MMMLIVYLVIAALVAGTVCVVPGCGVALAVLFVIAEAFTPMRPGPGGKYP